MDIQDRIKNIRERLGLSQAEFGEKLTLERSTISLMERKQRNVTDRTIKDICREFNVSYLWLTEGVGDIFLPDEADTTAMFDRIMAGSNETAKALFKSLAKLNDSEWEVIYKIINDVSKTLEQKK